ncbi:hypothetical protein [Urechidicola croceus]|uniref:Uncharacterized protein n=1 Tax=Urechidicola croceus TaxID=1850246 RepID=A0A1D8P9C7_9FLAO|nr:hypothetical protein [Urechidicola croceus]AOW21155.1 hypothetical protein LPB138_10905 [Urechidicola croceus]
MSDKEIKSPITVKEEEIDLGKLFSIIGNLFSNLFKFLGNFFKTLYHYIILLLIFIKNNFIKIFVFTIIGTVFGFVVDQITPVNYTYDMIIQPNYNSVDHLLEKVEYYNVLIKEGDSISLAKEFDISYSAANDLVNFQLNSHETDKDKLLAYDEFIKSTDTLTHKLFSYKDFIGDGPSRYDSRFYVYRITSKSNHLKSLQDKIISDVENIPILQKRKRINVNSLKLDSIATRVALRDIDSLRNLYKKATLLELEKENKGSASTYIDFSKESNLNNDIELFHIAKNLNDNLISIERSKETSEDIISVITHFNPVGNDRSTFTDSFTFNFARVFLALVLLLLLIKKLVKYLNNYQNS